MFPNNRWRSNVLLVTNTVEVWFTCGQKEWLQTDVPYLADVSKDSYHCHTSWWWVRSLKTIDIYQEKQPAHNSVIQVNTLNEADWQYFYAFFTIQHFKIQDVLESTSKENGQN